MTVRPTKIPAFNIYIYIYIYIFARHVYFRLTLPLRLLAATLGFPSKLFQPKYISIFQLLCRQANSVYPSSSCQICVPLSCLGLKVFLALGSGFWIWCTIFYIPFFGYIRLPLLPVTIMYNDMGKAFHEYCPDHHFCFLPIISVVAFSCASLGLLPFGVCSSILFHIYFVLSIVFVSASACSRII